mgnify:FL=1
MKKSNINEVRESSNIGLIRKRMRRHYMSMIKLKDASIVVGCILAIVLSVFFISVKSNSTQSQLSVNDVNPNNIQLLNYATTSTTCIKTTTSTTTSTATTVDTTTTTTTTTIPMPPAVSTVVNEQIDTTIETEAVVAMTSVEEDIAVDETPCVTECIMYKPSTHYVHRSTCHWVDSSCYEITSTEGLESRKCSECNPDIDIVTEYVVETPTIPSGVVNTSEHAALNYVTEEERIYLVNTVATEYGCDWISQYDKALVVAVVMNRLADGGWQGSGRDNTIYNIITAPGQFNPNYAVPYYRYNVTESCITAVDYYFENMEIFPHYTSFYGDGTRNYFR